MDVSCAAAALVACANCTAAGVPLGAASPVSCGQKRARVASPERPLAFLGRYLNLHAPGNTNVVYMVCLGNTGYDNPGDLLDVACGYGGLRPDIAAPNCALFASMAAVTLYMERLTIERPLLARSVLVVRLGLDDPHDADYLDALEAMVQTNKATADGNEVMPRAAGLLRTRLPEGAATAAVLGLCAFARGESRAFQASYTLNQSGNTLELIATTTRVEANVKLEDGTYSDHASRALATGVWPATDAEASAFLDAQLTDVLEACGL